MHPKQRLLSFTRRLVGQQQTLQQLQQLQQQHEQQQQQYWQLQQQLLALSNGLKYSFTEPDAVRATTTYKRCSQIISMLSPMDVVGAKYSRVGKDFDGGYVMLDDFTPESIEAAYSFGIADDVSWDEEIADRGIEVFMYDHTIDKLPVEHPRFHYFKLGITGYKKDPNLNTLSENLAHNGHTERKNLIMKMDVEGCEWDVFQQAETGIINQFSQIIIEFHDLIAAVYDSGKLVTVLSVLEKINKTHQSVHAHANGSTVPLSIGDLALSDVMEITYLRRDADKYQFVPNTRQFPTDLDQPTYAGGYDVYLGRFDADSS